MRILAHALATAAALVAATPVSAQDSFPSITVKSDGLDLASPAGRARMERRIAAAVRTVCEVGRARDLASVLAENRCAAETAARSRQALASLTGDRAIAVAALSPVPAR